MQSTLFNALCEGSHAQAANFPFCTIEPNMGIVAVPDSRLEVGHICSTGWLHICNVLHCHIDWIAAADTAYRQNAPAGTTVIPQVLSGIASSATIIPTTVEFVDIAGLVKGASKGEGLGNKFLANIRECNSIVQVFVSEACHLHMTSRKEGT